MKTLALDISTKSTGWAFFNDLKLSEFSVIKSPAYFAGCTKNNLLFSKAIFWFCGEINKLCKRLQPDEICAEDINIQYIMIMRSMAQFHAAASIGISIYNKDKVLNKISNASIRSQFGLPILKTIPKEMKDLAKSKGTEVTKMIMVDTINRQFNLNLQYSENDIADAIAVGTVFLIR